MAELNFNLSEWEQGTIVSSGNSSSDTRIRTPGCITLTASSPASYTVTAYDTDGNPLDYNVMMYDSNGVCVLDSPWYSSGKALADDRHNADNIRICLRYSDQRNISPEMLGSCHLLYVYSEWVMQDGEPTVPDFLPLPSEPFVEDAPDSLWRIDPDVNDGFPFNMLIPMERPSGAFKDAVNLVRADIPQSCKKIGKLAFANTALKKVKIAADCEYFSSSFPKDCEVEFYGEVGSFGQLYDSDGYAILDADSTRIYVKE